MTQAISFFNAVWKNGIGDVFQVINPSNGQLLWEGPSCSDADVMDALAASKIVQKKWEYTSPEKRIELLQKYGNSLNKHSVELAHIISLCTGKPSWESIAEVNAMIGKIPISIEAYKERSNTSQVITGSITSQTSFKPLGVVAVFGPFNFPGHLPNGHIVPALLAGNSIVFKPSEFVPLVAVKMLECMLEAGFPENLVQVIQGKSATGKALAQSGKIRGLFFTGSSTTGKILHQHLLANPMYCLLLKWEETTHSLYGIKKI